MDGRADQGLSAAGRTLQTLQASSCVFWARTKYVGRGDNVQMEEGANTSQTIRTGGESELTGLLTDGRWGGTKAAWRGLN